MLRRNAVVEIAGAAAQNELVTAQRHVDDIRIGHLQGADRHVKTLLEWIDGAIHQGNFEIDAAMQLQNLP